MSLLHLKEKTEFYSLCLQHGPENVQWTGISHSNPSPKLRSRADKDEPPWIHGRTYEFLALPPKVVMPEAVLPDEDCNGKACIYVRTGSPDDSEEFLISMLAYSTAEDRDAVVAAMLRRGKR